MAIASETDHLKKRYYQCTLIETGLPYSNSGRWSKEYTWWPLNRIYGTFNL